jgi:O-acetylserine/cysteine efflux transporter
MPAAQLSVRDLLLTLVICVVWAANFVAAANGMQHFSPFLFTVLRFVLVLIVLAPFLRRPPRGQWGRLITVCLIMGGVHFSLIFWALARSEDISSVAIVQQSYIPMAVLLAIGLMGERVGWKTLAAIFVSFSGVLIVGLDPLVLGQLDVLFLTLASALSQAIGSIYQRGIRGVGVLNFQAWTAVIALPPLAAAMFLTESGQLETIRSAGWEHWASVVYSALLASIVGHGLFFFLVQRNPVSAVMPYLQLTPVMAVVFGILLWGDRPGWRLLAGGSLVILGIVAITLRARQRAARRVPIQGSPD